MQNTIKNLTTILVSWTFLCGACDQETAPDVAPDAESVTPAQFGLGDDWVPLEEGLWTRFDAAGEQEFAALGEAGKLHAIASLEQIEMEIARALKGSEEREPLVAIRELISSLQTVQRTEEEDATTLRCSSIAIGSAFAQPIPCAVSASASAKYSNNCGSTGTISTYAGAICDNELVVDDSCNRTGKSVSCSSSASLSGIQCTSYAYMTIPGASLWKVNYVKGICGTPDEGAWGP